MLGQWGLVRSTTWMTSRLELKFCVQTGEQFMVKNLPTYCAILAHLLCSKNVPICDNMIKSFLVCHRLIQSSIFLVTNSCADNNAEVHSVMSHTASDQKTGCGNSLGTRLVCSLISSTYSIWTLDVNLLFPHGFGLWRGSKLGKKRENGNRGLWAGASFIRIAPCVQSVCH